MWMQDKPLLQVSAWEGTEGAGAAGAVGGQASTLSTLILLLQTCWAESYSFDPFCAFDGRRGQGLGLQ